MQLYKLNEGAKQLGLAPTDLRPYLNNRVIANIHKQSLGKDNKRRTTYYIPELFISYSVQQLGLANAKGFKKLANDEKVDYSNKNGALVISFSNLKGGVGKTSIAANFAYTLALLNKRVLIIDMDAQANTSRYFANRYFTGKSIKNIFEMMSKKEQVDHGVIKEHIETIRFENGAVDLLPSELALGRVIEFSRAVFTMPHKKLKDIIKHIKDDYDFIIVDTPPTTGLALHMSLFASDLVSIVTDAEDFSVNGLNELSQEIKEMEEETEHEVKVDSIFINKVKKSNLHTAYIGAIAEFGIAEGISNIFTINDSIRFKESQSLHLPILEYRAELEKKLTAAESLIEYAIEKALES
jgi:chromosome partitioning protein